MVRSFFSWWNSLATRNGKVKFRNHREAADFIRALGKAAAPNQEMIEMHKQYEDIRRRQEENRAA